MSICFIVFGYVIMLKRLKGLSCIVNIVQRRKIFIGKLYQFMAFQNPRYLFNG